IFACQNFGGEHDVKITKADFVKITTRGFAATRLEISYKESAHERQAAEMLKSLSKCCDSLGLGERAKAFALGTFNTIALAEAKIHNETFENVHLHEAGSIDTLVDIVGAATALQDLGLFEARLYSTKVAVGGGLLEFSHGTVPNPGAAILEIFREKRFVIVGGQADT